MLFGDCIVLVGIVEAIFFAIDQINVDCKDLHTVMLNVEAIIDFLDTKPTIKSTSGVNASAGDIEFRNVSFKFAERHIRVYKNRPIVIFISKKFLKNHF